MRKTYFSHIACLLLLGAVLLGGLARAGYAQGDNVVATVNGEKITEPQLVDALKARYGYGVRELLIRNVVVEQEAKKKGLTVTDAEIDQAMAADRTSFEQQNSGATFDQWLAQQGMTMESYRSSMRIKLLLQKMVAGDVKDEQVQALYDALPPQPEAFRLSYINVGTQDDADRLRADLIAGKLTWEQAAKQYNLDPYGREKGTDLGWVAKSNIPETMLQALQKDGDITSPMKVAKPPVGGGEWNLVRRDGYRPQGRPPLADVQVELRQQLIAQASQRRLAGLLEVADVKRFGDYKKPGE